MAGGASPLASGRSSIALLWIGCPAPYQKKATEMQISRALLGEDPLHHGDFELWKVSFHHRGLLPPQAPESAASLPAVSRCPQACPSMPAPRCNTSAGLGSRCRGQSQLTHPSPSSHGCGTATLPRQSRHLLNRDFPRSLHPGIFPLFLCFHYKNYKNFLPQICLSPASAFLHVIAPMASPIPATF